MHADPDTIEVFDCELGKNEHSRPEHAKKAIFEL